MLSSLQNVAKSYKKSGIALMLDYSPVFLPPFTTYLSPLIEKPFAERPVQDVAVDLLGAIVLTSEAFAFNVARGASPSAKVCTDVKKCITSAKQQASATSFCKSYMCASTTTVNSVTTRTVVSTATSTATVIPTACLPPVFGNLKRREVAIPEAALEVKRRNAAPKKPSCLSRCSPRPTLSSACSCIGITKTVSTATSTSTAKSTYTTTSVTTVFAGAPVPIGPVSQSLHSG